MRIIVTSDLHYNVPRGRDSTAELARTICAQGGDALLFVGDSAGSDLRVLEQAFGLFEAFSGVRMAVAGNHELWTDGDVDSLQRYEHAMAAACRRSGVHYLDAAPLVLDGVGFVGSVGWYDFSFRPSRMGIPLRFYQHKVSPGAAAHFPGHRHLLESAADLPPGAMDVTCRWMDGQRVRLPMGDVDFTLLTVARLRRHLSEIHDHVDQVVAAVHHLPFAELVPHSVIPNWEFATGFLGSELLGETLLDFPKVRHVFCGHSHRARRLSKRHLRAVSIGSTYREKQYEVVEL